MNIVMIKICLSLLLLVVVLRIKNSSQNVYSDEESIDQCIIHASEYDELETDQKKYNSKGMVRLPYVSKYRSLTALMNSFRNILRSDYEF